MISVNDLLDGVRVIEISVREDLQVGAVHHDSRQVGLGDVFVAVPGEKVNGDRFLAQAHSQGALVVVGANREALLPYPNWVLVEDPRKALALMAHNAFRRPSAEALLIGITGTNGKTSLTWILESIALAAEMKPGVLGTVNYRYGDHSEPAAHTTPEAPVLQGILRTMVDAGCDVIFMEVSSHALAMQRVLGCQWSVVGATNLSPEHLDFHTSIKEYGETKARLFTELLPESSRAKAAVINLDDDWAASLQGGIDGKVITVTIENRPADVCVRDARVSAAGIMALIDSPAGCLKIRSALGGKHNLSNITLAVGIACALGWPREAIEKGIAMCARIPGRMDAVVNDLGLHIWVDYAHTPDAMENALQAARGMTDGDLWVVFGAGGDRDRSKRPLMGAAASQGADRPVITSDNPRTEDPENIIDEILEGIPKDRRDHVILEVDRAAAIRTTLLAARPGDGVVIAGKGHETYVEVNGVRSHFDDREIAGQVLAEIMGGRHVR